MTSRRLGCIADDYTGATDLCSMLLRAGRRVIQCFGIADLNQVESLQDADAIVVALKSRSIPAAEAVQLSLKALRCLQDWGADRYFFKYCSTFDSTPAGNIGPVADALADALGIDQLLFCPAFPENGRTVHCGHLFVDGVPLNESGMRNHPLNPMTDSSLVRVLQAQSSQSVGWIASDADPATSTSSRLIVDAVNDDDLRAAAEQAKQHVLLTGGSAIARYWAEAADIRKSGSWPDLASNHNQSMPSVILAGSCSEATRGQVAEFAKLHPVLYLPIDAADNPESIAQKTLQWCEDQWSQRDQATHALLISSGATADAIDAARKRWGERESAERTEQIFAMIAVGLEDRGITRLIVAGGETSGSVINALDIRAIRIGHEIAAGVPWVTSTGQPPLSLVLKSGNFGGPRFFFDALETAR